MKISKLGIKLTGVYLIIALPLCLWAVFDADPKGSWLLLSLATLPAGMFVTYTGLISTVMTYSSLNNFYVQIAFSAMITYCIGWFIELIARRLKS
jgi:hypothetical protein